MSGNKNATYLTEAGLDELVNELDIYKKEKRPEVIRALKEARALGDLSENAEYHAAREEQAQIESRIAELEALIDNAMIIEQTSNDEVTIGTTVKIRYVDDGEEEEYQIVGRQEANPFNNKISNESPIAQAIIGKKIKDVVSVDSPNGKYDVEIIEIN